MKITKYKVISHGVREYDDFIGTYHGGAFNHSITGMGDSEGSALFDCLLKIKADIGLKETCALKKDIKFEADYNIKELKVGEWFFVSIGYDVEDEKSEMVIDLNLIAQNILGSGLDFRGDEIPDGFTNAICDSLVENYPDFEEKLLELIKKGK